MAVAYRPLNSLSIHSIPKRECKFQAVKFNMNGKNWHTWVIHLMSGE